MDVHAQIERRVKTLSEAQQLRRSLELFATTRGRRPTLRSDASPELVYYFWFLCYFYRTPELLNELDANSSWRALVAEEATCFRQMTAALSGGHTPENGEKAKWACTETERTSLFWMASSLGIKSLADQLRSPYADYASMHEVLRSASCQHAGMCSCRIAHGASAYVQFNQQDPLVAAFRVPHVHDASLLANELIAHADTSARRWVARRAAAAFSANVHCAAQVGVRVRGGYRPLMVEGAIKGDRARLFMRLVAAGDMNEELHKARPVALVHNSVRVVTLIVAKLGITTLLDGLSLNLIQEFPIETRMIAAENCAMFLAACVASNASPFAPRVCARVGCGALLATHIMARLPITAHIISSSRK